MVTRPVIILGAPRAGTSVLGRLLEAHPVFVHVKEPRFVWRYGNDRLSDILPAEAARPNVIRHIHRHFDTMIGMMPSFGCSRRRRAIPCGFPSSTGSFRTPSTSTSFGTATTRRFRSAGIGRTSPRDLARGERDRSSRSLRSALPKCIPRRSPGISESSWAGWSRAATESRARFWGPRLPGMRQMVREMDLLEVAALQWRACVERARIDGRAIAPDRYMEVRLEDLDETRLTEIFRFLDLDYAPEAWRYFNEEFTPSMAGSRRDTLKGLTAEERTMLRRIVEPTSTWLGYSEP